MKGHKNVLLFIGSRPRFEPWPSLLSEIFCHNLTDYYVIVSPCRHRRRPLDLEGSSEYIE